MKRIKILFLISGLAAGGAELMLNKIISKLNNTKYEIIVCSLTSIIDILSMIKKHAKSIYILNINCFFNVFTGFVKLRKIIKSERPDIIHCFMPHSNIFGRFAAIGFNCKVISSIRVKLIEKKYLNLVDRITQRFVDIYMVNSKTLKKFVLKYGIKEQKIILIENGIDFNTFKETKSPEEIKKELKIPENTIVITMVAHLRKQKDYTTMIRTISLLQNEMDFIFLSIGSGTIFENETYKIKSLIKKLKINNIRLLGYRKDVPNILSITDIWVSSTLYEGQSNSLLEAMAMKKLIITTNIDENVELIRNCKEGILVPVKSPDELANAIKNLVDNKQKSSQLAENAFNRVKKYYDIEKTIKKLEYLYMTLME